MLSNVVFVFSEQYIVVGVCVLHSRECGFLDF
jgi:hypothetical protein